MLTRSDDYVAYCREAAKHARDPHDLALRGGKAHEITRLTHERIVEVTKLWRTMICSTSAAAMAPFFGWQKAWVSIPL